MNARTVVPMERSHLGQRSAALALVLAVLFWSGNFIS